MGKLTDGLPLFSLVQVSPYLHDKIKDSLEKRFPDLMRRIRKLKSEELSFIAKEEGVTPRGENLLNRPPVPEVALNITNIYTTEMFSIFEMELQIPFFCSGEGAKLRKATQRALRIEDANTNGYTGTGVAISVTLCGEDTPLQIMSPENGLNGRSRRYFIAKKEKEYFSNFGSTLSLKETKS